MRLVVIESPYAGDVERNLAYVRACMADCLRRGEAPFASHALYTQPGVLDDKVPEQRALGIAAGLEVAARFDLRAFYLDLGWSNGMRAAHELCVATGQPFEGRYLYEWWSVFLDPGCNTAEQLARTTGGLR